MIKNIQGNGHVVIEGGYFNTFPPSSAASMSGMLRYNLGNIEGYDGYNWHVITSGFVTVNLSHYANEAIDWAVKKMAEEREIENMARTNLVVRSAYENLKNAEKQLKTTIILSKDESTS